VHHSDRKAELQSIPRAMRMLVCAAIAAVFLPPAHAPAQTQADSAHISQFLLGADISALDSPFTRRPASASANQPAAANRPSSGFAFRPMPLYQENGKAGDELSILRRHGWNAYRIRVFVSPVRQAPNNTLENAIPLARKIKESGAILILDLHFSDTWSDPKHQEIPIAWRGMGIKALARQWQTHARDTVKAFKDAGARPDIVQVGNEITRGTAWPLAELQVPGWNQPDAPQPVLPQSSDQVKLWKNLILLLKAGERGVNEGAGHIRPQIAIHIDQGGHWDKTEWFFDHLNAAHVHYDIIAESFYPPWRHGTLDDLWDNMRHCAKKYPGKKFLVMETGYNPSHEPDNKDMLWPVTSEGRLQYMVDLVNTVRKAPNGMGVIYWAPERDFWNADGTPGPTVFTMDRLAALAKSPESHAPSAVSP